MKVKLGIKNCLYPMPTTLIGAMVNGKPNYTTIAHVGIMDLTSVSLGMNKSHYTNFCGLVSGKNDDKAHLFKTFFGTLETAPMIDECTINMECQLVRTVDFPNHDIFIGRITETYCNEAVLTDGNVDFGKVQPILFVMNTQSYWKIGTKIAKAWNIGKELSSQK
jgi:hypothetical protein